MAAWTYGMFVWRELMSWEPSAALRFYGELVGWKSKPMQTSAGTYHLLQCGEKQVGGVLALGPESRAPTSWMSYLSVPDVDAAATVAKERGASVVWGPEDIPQVGRAATVLDPQGAIFSLLHAFDGDPAPLGPPGPGEFCWEQLHCQDFVKARDFYGALVGWKVFPAPDGATETFGFGERPGEQAASLVTPPPHTTPGWLTFVTVDDLPAARARTVRLGGRVLIDSVPVPGVGTYAVIADPQGAVLGLFNA